MQRLIHDLTETCKDNRKYFYKGFVASNQRPVLVPSFVISEDRSLSFDFHSVKKSRCVNATGRI